MTHVLWSPHSDSDPVHGHPHEEEEQQQAPDGREGQGGWGAEEKRQRSKHCGEAEGLNGWEVGIVGCRGRREGETWGGGKGRRGDS